MAYLLMILPIAFQVILVIHVFRTGRDRFWIYIIIFLPMAGGIAYLILEILIPFFRGSGARRAVGNMQKVIDPGRTLRALEDEARFAPTTANNMRLAEAYLDADRPAEAADILRSCLVGPFKNDETIIVLLAKAENAKGNHAEAIALFEQLESKGVKLIDDSFLVWADSCEQAQRHEEAEKIYLKAVDSSPGLEARYRYAEFLKHLGRESEMNQEIKRMIEVFERLPSYMRRSEKCWVQTAQKNLLNG
jgi:hypothetical protein